MRGIADLRAYIDTHFAEPLTIARLARMAGLSPFHFIRAFHTEVGQTPHQYVLMEPKPGPMLDDEAAQAVQVLLRKGVLGAGVFQVDDCRKTYEQLKAKGVQFAGAERFYGIEAIVKDGLGNRLRAARPQRYAERRLIPARH